MIQTTTTTRKKKKKKKKWDVTGGSIHIRRRSIFMHVSRHLPKHKHTHRHTPIPLCKGCGVRDPLGGQTQNDFYTIYDADEKNLSGKQLTGSISLSHFYGYSQNTYILNTNFLMTCLKRVTIPLALQAAVYAHRHCIKLCFFQQSENTTHDDPTMVYSNS